MISYELKRQWIEAARSGKYKQCFGALAFGDKHYCILGLLGHVGGVSDEDLMGMQGILSEKTRHAFYESAIHFDISHPLISLNDGRHLSFLELAEWIEVNVPCEPRSRSDSELVKALISKVTTEPFIEDTEQVNCLEETA